MSDGLLTDLDRLGALDDAERTFQMNDEAFRRVAANRKRDHRRRPNAATPERPVHPWFTFGALRWMPRRQP